MVNTRSMGRRGLPRSARGGWCASRSASAATRSPRPSPVRAETGMIGLPSKTVPCTVSMMSSCTSSSQSGSLTKSILVSAISPVGTASRSRMARCSRVWGITPSSAAMTSSATSMPPTPASIFSMKSRCPGTSTMPTRSPVGRSSQAKPRSMVISRRCSSARRSGLMPVRAWVSVDLP